MQSSLPCGRHPNGNEQKPFCLDRRAAQSTVRWTRCRGERGTLGTGTLATRRSAVIIDEAHSSQGGETATDLKEVLGGEALREEASKKAAEEGLADMEELFRSMAKRGRQANLSFFAFTATPKHKTLAVFGRNGEPADRYTMRQAIEERFILDVLKYYTTYATYFKLLKACDDDPNVERKKAAKESSAVHEITSAQHRAEDGVDRRAFQYDDAT